LVSDALARELAAHVRTFAPATQPTPATVGSTPAPSATAQPGTTPSDKAWVSSYVPTGDFETDFNTLAKEFEDLQRLSRQVSSAPVPPAPLPPTSAPSAPAPAVTVSPGNPPPVTPPEEAVSPVLPKETGTEKPQMAPAPISDRPFTPEDVARGRELFLGRQPLANSGQACIGCHAVNRAEARDGGTLGPDLTKAYERMGGRTALETYLWSPTKPTMRTVYRQHTLASDEVLAVAAYLEDTASQTVADTSPLPWQLLLLGLGGTVLVLAVVSTFWTGHPREKARLIARTIPTSPPADDVGAGR
jgi:mono/diheme cytochrome c family protein